MKTLNILLAGATFLGCGTCLRASGMVSPESCPTGTTPIGSTFSFQADSLGGSSLFPHTTGGMLNCMFKNVSSSPFTTLTFTTPLPMGTSLSNFTCGLFLFNICNVTLNSAGNTLIFNFGLRPNSDNFAPPGIPQNSEFAIDLGTNGFAPGQTFMAAANGASVPEPGSAMLVLAGVAALLAARKRRRETT